MKFSNYAIRIAGDRPELDAKVMPSTSLAKRDNLQESLRRSRHSHFQIVDPKPSFEKEMS
jgi:hypothetical protein